MTPDEMRTEVNAVRNEIAYYHVVRPLNLTLAERPRDEAMFKKLWAQLATIFDSLDRKKRLDVFSLLVCRKLDTLQAVPGNPSRGHGLTRGELIAFVGWLENRTDQAGAVLRELRDHTDGWRGLIQEPEEVEVTW